MAITRIITPAVTDDAVTLAKMAPGTDGNLITYDASGNPAAVATGSAGQVLTSAGAGAPPTFATASGGITEIDYFRLSADVSGSGNSSYVNITSNWERVDTHNFAKLGTGLTESSGFFSFPSTGYWKIDFNFTNVATQNNYLRIKLHTTNNNSSYSTAVETQVGQTQSEYAICAGFYIFNVTNTTNDKFIFSQSTSGGNVQGSTSTSKSSFTCVRLADT